MVQFLDRPHFPCLGVAGNRPRESVFARRCDSFGQMQPEAFVGRQVAFKATELLRIGFLAIMEHSCLKHTCRAILCLWSSGIAFTMESGRATYFFLFLSEEASPVELPSA